MLSLSSTPTRGIVLDSPDSASSKAALSFPREVLINIAHRLERKDQLALGLLCKTYADGLKTVVLGWRLPVQIHNSGLTESNFSATYKDLEENRFNLDVAVLSDSLAQLTDHVYFLDKDCMAPAFRKFIESLEWLAVPWRAQVLVKLKHIFAEKPEILGEFKDVLESACTALKKIDDGHAKLAEVIEKMAAMDPITITARGGKKILADIQSLPATLRGVVLGLVPMMYKHLWSKNVATKVIDLARTSPEIRGRLLILLGNHLLYLLRPENNLGRPICTPGAATFKQVLIRLRNDIPDLEAHFAQTLAEMLIEAVSLTPGYGHAYQRTLSLVEICLERDFSTDSTWQALVRLCSAAFKDRQAPANTLDRLFQGWMKCKAHSDRDVAAAFKFAWSLPLETSTQIFPKLWKWGVEHPVNISGIWTGLACENADQFRCLTALSEQTSAAAKVHEGNRIRSLAGHVLVNLLERLKRFEDGPVKEELLHSLLQQVEQLPTEWKANVLVSVATGKFYRKQISESIKLTMVVQKCLELDEESRARALGKILQHQLRTSTEEKLQEVCMKQIVLVEDLGAKLIGQAWSYVAKFWGMLPAWQESLLAAGAKLPDQDKITLITALLAPVGDYLMTLSRGETLPTTANRDYEQEFKNWSLFDSLLPVLKKQSPTVIQAVTRQMVKSLIALPDNARQEIAERLKALAAQVSTDFQAELASLLPSSEQ